MARTLGILVASVLVLAAAAFFAVGASMVDGQLNRVAAGPIPAPSARAQALHASMQVVDLHADPLLWNRDILERADRGQVDVPRLIEGNVALQVFGVPTKTPLGTNYERTRADAFDLVTLLTVASAWPPATWTSLRERALHQAHMLHKAEAASAGVVTIVKSREDLAAAMGARDADPGRVAALLALEGLHALEGELGAIDALFEAGYRMMGLAHFFDNEASGSSAGEEKYGLTPFGRDALRRMEALGMVIDLAHASPKAIVDTLALVKHPVVVSHTGVQATCPGPRNLSDDEILAIAENGGVIGIGYWEAAVCGATATRIAGAMRHVRDLVGARHLALGSDFDGAVVTAIDSSQTVVIVDALLEEGFSETEIRAVMGENALRVIAQGLPGGRTAALP